ncbi:MAG: AbrB/MazE/SpoVT family DNA-binding domain-containing protein [Thermoproteota archaeon]
MSFYVCPVCGQPFVRTSHMHKHSPLPAVVSVTRRQSSDGTCSIYLPLRVAEALGLNPGDRLLVDRRGDEIVMRVFKPGQRRHSS